MDEWTRDETKEGHREKTEEKNQKKQHAFEEGRGLRSCLH